MLRNIPIAMGVLVIVGLTIVEIKMSDRFQGSNVTAERFAKLLANVPMTIGDWRGEDLPVEEQVRKTAGAVGYVSRSYFNNRTGETVKLWLIVGHARHICGHTPDICYPSSGFRSRAENNSLYPMDVEGLPPAEFWTNTFLKEDISGRQLVRVFWAWYVPKEGEPVQWVAPKNPRWVFGNARAVYKMYFTNEMRDAKETADRSSSVRFAREFLPVVDQALTRVEHEDSGASAPAA